MIRVDGISFNQARSIRSARPSPTWLIAKSHFTFRHSQGVADAAFGIAKEMGLPAERVQMVRRAALLHDIGKLGVSNTILNKRSELTGEEWKAVYRHPRITRLILERVASFREWR